MGQLLYRYAAAKLARAIDIGEEDDTDAEEEKRKDKEDDDDK
jgi:hypothetical protein